MRHKITIAVLALGIFQSLAWGDEQVARGEKLYEKNCAACHDSVQGAVPRLTRKVLAPYATAAGLFNYIEEFMPYQAGKSLQRDEYWDITAFVLERSGLLPKGIVLGNATAKSISLRK